MIPRKLTPTTDLRGVRLAQRRLDDTAKNAKAVALAAIKLPKHIYQKATTNTEPTWIGPWNGQVRSVKRAKYLRNIATLRMQPAEWSITSLNFDCDGSTSSALVSEHSSSAEPRTSSRTLEVHADQATGAIESPVTPPFIPQSSSARRLEPTTLKSEIEGENGISEEPNFSEPTPAIREPRNVSPTTRQVAAYCHGTLYMPSSIRKVRVSDNLRYPSFIPEMAEIDIKQELIERFHQLSYVPQSEGRASSEFPLVSIGFRECSAIILKNTETGEYLLMHHDDGVKFLGDLLLEVKNSSNLIEADRFGYRAFMNKPGPKKVLLVEGDYSFNRAEVIEYIVNDGATALAPLRIKSGRQNNSGYDKGEYRWDVIVRPKTGAVIVYLKDIGAPAVLSFDDIFSDIQ